MSTTDERDRLAIDDLRNAWVVLSTEERVLGFGLLSADQAEEFFLGLEGADSRRAPGRAAGAGPPALDAPARARRRRRPHQQAASEEARTRLLELLDESPAARSPACSPTPKTTPAAS